MMSLLILPINQLNYNISIQRPDQMVIVLSIQNTYKN